MSRWRKRLEVAGAEKMLAELLVSGMQKGFIKANDIKRVVVDTTVQEKHIRFPTDARLYDRMREHLVKQAQKEGITLRQNYRLVSKKLLKKQSRYSHAKQYKRAQKTTSKLKTYLGRVTRDIERKSKEQNCSLRLTHLLELAQRLLKQQKHDHNKLYSIHEPDVECIGKSKIHKPYEFGCKVSLVSTAKSNRIIGAQALHGNPYDGHTLQGALEQMQHLSRYKALIALCDGTCPRSWD